jgi:hypothetical protein
MKNKCNAIKIAKTSFAQSHVCFMRLPKFIKFNKCDVIKNDKISNECLELTRNLKRNNLERRKYEELKGTEVQR